MHRFDFSSAEYNRLLSLCPFSDEEKRIIEMRRRGESTVYICGKLNISERTLRNRLKSIAKKIIAEMS